MCRWVDQCVCSAWMPVKYKWVPGSQQEAHSVCSRWDRRRESEERTAGPLIQLHPPAQMCCWMTTHLHSSCKTKHTQTQQKTMYRRRLSHRHNIDYVEMQVLHHVGVSLSGPIRDKDLLDLDLDPAVCPSRATGQRMVILLISKTNLYQSHSDFLSLWIILNNLMINICVVSISWPG